MLERLNSPAILINGLEDHVHILCLLSRSIAIKDLIEESKTSTSKWIKTKGLQYREFYWQPGYGAFSVSESNVEEVKRYIANQEEHHRTVTFQEEFRKLCERHGVLIDERYVWD